MGRDDGRQVTLVVRTESGEEQALEVPGPGGTVRVAVGEPGRRSSVWRVWARPNKSDVYVAARVLAGTIKFSLHESGDWRHQWVSASRAKQFAGVEQRILDAWPRPAPGPGGWTKGLTIWIPASDIQEIAHDGQSEAGVEWTPPPPPDVWMGFHVVVAETGHGFLELRHAAPRAAFWLADGKVVLVLVSTHRPSDEEVAWLDHQRARIRGASGRIPDDYRSARAALFGSDSTGLRFVWDLSLGGSG